MIFNGASFGFGFLAGFGAGVLAREIFATASSVVAPVSRRVARAGVHVAERGKEVVAGIGESFEDLVAEVEAELEGRRGARKKTVVGGPGSKTVGKNKDQKEAPAAQEHKISSKSVPVASGSH